MRGLFLFFPLFFSAHVQTPEPEPLGKGRPGDQLQLPVTEPSAELLVRGQGPKSQPVAVPEDSVGWQVRARWICRCARLMLPPHQQFSRLIPLLPLPPLPTFGILQRGGFAYAVVSNQTIRSASCEIHCASTWQCTYMALRTT